MTVKANKSLNAAASPESTKPINRKPPPTALPDIASNEVTKKALIRFCVSNRLPLKIRVRGPWKIANMNAGDKIAQLTGAAYVTFKDMIDVSLNGAVYTDVVRVSRKGGRWKIKDRNDKDQPFEMNEAKNPKVKITANMLLIPGPTKVRLEEFLSECHNKEEPLKENVKENMQKTIGVLALSKIEQTDGNVFGTVSKPNISAIIKSINDTLDFNKLTSKGLSASTLADRVKEGIEVLKEKNAKNSV